MSEQSPSDRPPMSGGGDGEVFGKAPGAGDWKRITRLTALGVLIVYVVLFFLWNRETVEVSLVVTNVTIPLVFILMFTFLLGAAAMYLVLYLRKRAVRKARAK